MTSAAVTITVPPWKGVAVNGVWDNLFNKESRELSEYAKDQWVGKYRVLWRTISYRENPFRHLHYFGSEGHLCYSANICSGGRWLMTIWTHEEGELWVVTGISYHNIS